jgi:hypothetical protein
MNLRLLATSLFTTTLLLSTLGCSKKEDPSTPTTPTSTTGTGSFKRDGITITGTSRAYTNSFKDVRGQQVIAVYITITENTPSASDARSATLEFQNGGLYQITYKKGVGNGTDPTTYPYTSSTATLTQPTNASYSGTFAGTGTLNYASAASTITDGVFTDARL